MTSLTTQAVNKFSSGYNCGQSVFFAFCQQFDMDSETALKVSCGLGGGMATQQICGAVSGGVLALGLKYGRGKNEGREAVDQTYAKVRELFTRFEQKHGSTTCLDLLDNCNIRTPEGKERFKTEQLRDNVCAKCIQTAVEIVSDLLSENNQ